MSKVILNETEINRALTRISYEILERYDGIGDLVLVGIKTRGIYLAQKLQKTIEKLEGKIDVLELDVRMYRDDYEGDIIYSSNKSKVLEDKRIILVDDVLFTGRTIRASLDAIMDYGRPKSVALAVLVDRGHRELPIRPDFIGKNIPTSKNEIVKVLVEEVDKENKIILK